MNRKSIDPKKHPVAGEGPAQAATAACSLRRAEASDAAALLDLIRALAEFEHLTPPDDSARTRLVADGFGARPRFETWLAFVPGRDDPVGYALLFDTYSTFLARPTLYLEDLFVLPDCRGRGVGSALLRHCVRLARERNCGRMEWTCLNWNTRAQHVYERRLGAKTMREWLLFRMTQSEMDAYLRTGEPRA
jgi:GNAT superfamily N-acetyltransferase